jgi:hypothetical protein
MLKRSWKDWLLATITLALIVWLVSTSEAFKNCIHERKNEQPYRALHQRSAIIGTAIVGLRTRINLNIACAGNFADTNQGAITALATVFLALFTFTLWRSTTRLWKVSIEHVDIAKRGLVDVERPHVLIENVRMGGFRMTEEERREHAATGNFRPSVFPTIFFDIKNHGKSPAWVIAEVVRFMPAIALPLPPEYGAPTRLVRGYAISPDEKVYGECRLEPTPELTDDSRIQIVSGEMNLFVYGYVEYDDIFRDINLRPHRSAFCWQYIVGGGIDPGDRFVPSGPDAYWSYT